MESIMIHPDNTVRSYARLTGCVMVCPRNAHLSVLKCTFLCLMLNHFKTLCEPCSGIVPWGMGHGCTGATQHDVPELLWPWSWFHVEMKGRR